MNRSPTLKVYEYSEEMNYENDRIVCDCEKVGVNNAHNKK